MAFCCALLYMVPAGTMVVPVSKGFKMPYATTQDVARANDALRGGAIWDENCRMVITQGLGADSTMAVKAAVAVSAFNDFNEDNDPHGEHDFGSVDVDGERVFFKICYYADSTCRYGADPHEGPVFRVITMMLAEEW